MPPREGRRYATTTSYLGGTQDREEGERTRGKRQEAGGKRKQEEAREQDDERFNLIRKRIERDRERGNAWYCVILHTAMPPSAPPSYK